MMTFCRQECLKIGKVYTNRALEPGMTVGELQDKIKAKDPQVIGLCFLIPLSSLCLTGPNW